jgi:hypothetical protein
MRMAKKKRMSPKLKARRGRFPKGTIPGIGSPGGQPIGT